MTTPADTSGQQGADTQSQQQGSQGSQGNQPWYSSLPADLASNPTVQKYKTPEDQIKGHLELVKTLGSERIVWPKDPNDKAAWGEIYKKMGVPERPDGYNLKAVDIPKDLGMQTFDRVGFQTMMKELNAPPALAGALWEKYTDAILGGYKKATEEYTAKVNAAANENRKEWGEAYQANIERGQAVIDAFAGSPEEKEFITSSLAANPLGHRFLAKIGAKMAEASIGGFQEKKNFTLTPEEATLELDRIRANPDYMSDNEKSRMPLVERANELRRMINARGHQAMV